MIDILIPTYNRAAFLKKNLHLLIKQINEGNLTDKISILISDNHSSDNTIQTVNQIIENSNIKIKLYLQTENTGPEGNTVFLLEKSEQPYIMWLGDDDFIPDTYLKFLVEKIENIDNLTCVIPGFSGLYEDGRIIPVRNAAFEEKQYSPSFKTVMQISPYGHQLSGLLVKREGLFSTYMEDGNLRNIYPYIYYVAYNNLQGQSIYAPKFQVLVAQDNSKDWRYDDSGLLTEVFKNYKMLFKNNYLKRNIMYIIFMFDQTWRLRIGLNPLKALDAFVHIERDKNIDYLTKILLPLLYIVFIPKSYIDKLRKKIISQRKYA